MMQLVLHKKLFAADGMMEMNISCNIHNGKFVSLCGASGAGKTSILRMIAGFLRPDHGLVQFNDEVWFQSEKKVDLPPQQRKVGFVFQDYALFPNMTVKQNLQFALKKDEPQNYIDELMALTELEQLSKRNVLTLSGGQKQRVALARALVRKPGLLLLDEPLSAIDAELRYKLQDILIKIHRSYNLTTVLVSHDVTELARLSDEIFFVENGTIKKQGCPSEIFFSQLDHEDFAFKGSIAAIKKEDSAYFLYIVIGSQLIRHPVAETEIKEFSKGDKVILTSKAFRPFVKKIN